MSSSKYVKLTEDEKNALRQSLDAEFGESRMSYGAYIRYLAENRGAAE